MKVLVTGGSGYLGASVLEQLVACEHEVLALVRKPERLQIRGVKPVVGDLDRMAEWEEQLRSCHACVHLVSILREEPGYGLTFDRVNYRYTFDLLRACGRAGVARFIYMSANGVERALRTGYMSTKAQAEQAVRASAMDWTILRPSVVYGGHPDRYNFVDAVAGQMRRLPVFPYFGDGSYRLAPIAASQVAAAVAISLANPGATVGKAFHLCGHQVYTYRALLERMRDLGGFRCKLIGLPFWMAELASGLLGGQAWFPVTPGMLKLLKAGNTAPEGALGHRHLEIPDCDFEVWLGEHLQTRRGLPLPRLALPAAPDSQPTPARSDELTRPQSTRELTAEQLTQQLTEAEQAAVTRNLSPAEPPAESNPET